MTTKKQNAIVKKRKAPSTAGRTNRNSAERFTSYDTKSSQSASPQKVRENSESPAQHQREKKAKGDN